MIEFLSAHGESLMTAGLVAALVVVGWRWPAKLPQFLQVLSTISELTKNAESVFGALSTESKPLARGEIVKEIALNTKLVKEQVQRVVDIDDAGKVSVNKKALAVELLRTSDGKKLQRKVRKFVKKVF